jgi:hypothetical protein
VSFTPSKVLVNQIHETTKPAIEPAVLVGGTTTGTAATVYLILRFLIPGISDDLLNVISLVAALFLPLIVSLIIRTKVWSPATVKRTVKAAEDLAIEGVKLQTLRTALKTKPASPKLLSDNPTTPVTKPEWPDET